MTMDPSTADSTISSELDSAAAEYAAVRAEFDRARIRYAVAKKRLAITVQLGAEVMTRGEWSDWRENHADVRYVDSSVGEAIQDALRRHAYDSVLLTDVTGDRPAPPLGLTLDEILNALRAGGLDFRTITPLREVNAALIKLSGVNKLPEGLYVVEDLDTIIEKAKEDAMDVLKTGEEARRHAG